MSRRSKSFSLLAPVGALALLSTASAQPAAPVTPVTPAKVAATKLAPPAKSGSLLFKKKLNTGRANLKGIVDLHTHPMAHLAMGGKLLHGAPDKGILMPAGAIYDPKGAGMSGATCNGAARDAASVEEALGSCYSSHAGHDFIKNKCGNHIRRLVINGFEDGKHTNKPHDVEHPPGYPSFTKWPKYNDVIHQQMWIDWVKRAHDGGLRVMVALSVNSMTFAKGLDGNQPYDDKTTGDSQLKEMKRLVARHKDFMEIAYSSADLRRIVSQDKLAIILGSELDDIGNFAWSKKEPSHGEVKAEIDRLYKQGIRYMFPVHVIDNHFGGTAMYEAEFPRASKYHFGEWPKIICADKSDGITNRFTNGWDVIKTFALGDAGGSFPTPTCRDGIGFKNARGLTELGKFALDEMMSRGMMIDIDHGSQKTVDETVRHANSKKGGYPLVSGHNGLRDDNPRNHDIHENTRTAAQYKAIVANHGIAGIGMGESTAQSFIASVRRAQAAAPGLRVNLGSDINGFVIMPGPEKCEGDKCVKYSAEFPKAKMGSKEWDFNTDGVAHVGLFPDFLRKVELSGGKDIVDELFDGAEGVALMWEQAEKVSKEVKQPTTFDTIVVTVRTTADDVRDGAQAWVTVLLKSGELAEVEISKLAKGANSANRIEIPTKAAISATDVVGVKVRHFSNDCFACSRDYWAGSVELEGKAGQAIMRTPDFKIGHETQQYKRK